MRSRYSLVALSALALLGLANAASHADTIDFDAVSAPPFFSSVMPGGALGPILNYPDVMLDGGVILNDSSFGSYSTTTPNLYATSDFMTLADSSSLPGVITGTFSAPGVFNSISLDVANGFAAAIFTLSAFDASNMLINSSSIALTNFGSSATTSVGNLTVSGAGIKSFQVTSGQTAGDVDFAIDSIQLMRAGNAAVPEPGTVALLVGSGISGLCLVRRRVRK